MLTSSYIPPSRDGDLLAILMCLLMYSVIRIRVSMSGLDLLAAVS